jgi:hypothetical protein
MRQETISGWTVKPRDSQVTIFGMEVEKNWATFSVERDFVTMYKGVQMKQHDFQSGSSDGNFITGIFNYCDRWCERCTMTSRCMTFAVEKRWREGEDISDVMNEIFWNALEKSDDAPEKKESPDDQAMHLWFQSDDDDDDDDGDDAFHKEFDFMEQLSRKETEKHPCVIGGRKYFDLVHDWYRQARNLEQLSDEQLEYRITLGPRLLPDATTAATVRNLIEVITFYHLSIFAKLRRAVHVTGFEGDIGDDLPNDSDGSAKVALIGIDRSIAAWLQLHRCLQEMEEPATRAVHLLHRLRTVTEAQFPNARLFVRPGFDDEAA